MTPVLLQSRDLLTFLLGVMVAMLMTLQDETYTSDKRQTHMHSSMMFEQRLEGCQLRFDQSGTVAISTNIHNISPGL